MEEICAMSKKKPKSKSVRQTEYKNEDVPMPQKKPKRRRSQRRSETDLIYTKLQEMDENAEVLDIALPFRCLGKNSSLTDVNNLLENSAPPSPPLTYKQVNVLQLNENTALIMTKQIQEMKKQMEKLQKVVQEASNQKFSNDIDYVVNNIEKYFQKQEEVVATE
ncbi:hypothetical protein FQR65_LT10817 [Abscondita terminalis]|nr:hypothetical protein FQR65_LT10817 [Abscondita terminalis]